MFLLISLIMKGLTNPCSVIASSLLSVFNSTLHSIFVQKFLPTWWAGLIKIMALIELSLNTKATDWKEIRGDTRFHVWDAFSSLEQSSLRMSLEFSCSVTNRRTHKRQWKIHLCCSRRWSQVPQRKQCLQPLQPQQHPFFLLPFAIWNVWCHALWQEQAFGRFSK